MKRYILIITIFLLFFITFYTISSFGIDIFRSQNLSLNESTDDDYENEEVNEMNLGDDDFFIESNDNSFSLSNNIEKSTDDSNLPTSSIESDSKSENFFTVENIINVILIAVGIVLVFLAIAILIKIK